MIKRPDKKIDIIRTQKEMPLIPQLIFIETNIVKALKTTDEIFKGYIFFT